MRIRKLLALVVFALSVAATPAVFTPNPCFAFCAQINCVPEKVCGQYVNSSGQSVCGCHERP